MGKKLWRAAIAALLLVVPLMLAAVVHTGSAGAVSVPQTTLVNGKPVAYTPDVLDGDVHAVLQIGTKVIVGGSFTQVTNAGSQTVINRGDIFAFDATTGAVDTSFVPTVDGEVDTLLAATDGQSVYLGGQFKNVNGVASKSLARLSISNGQAVSGFATPKFSATIADLRMAGGRLYAGGDFAFVNGVSHTNLIAMNPSTGALDPFMSLTFAGIHEPGAGRVTQVIKFDITPDASKLVALGNFTTVGGQNRQQIVMINLTGTGATVANWYTPKYEPHCSASIPITPRDIDFSPDGSFFVVGGTGGPHGNQTLCDSIERFETNATGTAIQPSWIDFTGGDSIYAIAVVGNIVYDGGHNRWLNNDFGGDSAGQGAMDRAGISAISAINGVPYDWNPGRVRGHAVYDLTSTANGLYVGDDTDQIAGQYHAKLAYFPLAGGKSIPAEQTGALPNDIYFAGANSGNAVTSRAVTTLPGTVGVATTVDPGGITWSSARGGVMIDGTLYTGWSDGNFYGRSFDGKTFGAAVSQNAADLITPESTWHSEVPSISGMFFTNGRLYFTKSGASKLYYRYFNSQSGALGAQDLATSTVLPSTGVGDMFLSGSTLYYVTSADGNLHATSFANGTPGATSSIVSGPTMGGVDWRAKAVWLGPKPVNNPPTATFTTSCSALSCTFDGSGSSDPDGSISSYSWNYGDGTPDGSGSSVSHTFSQDGTYTVTLTVTDNGGATGTAGQQVTVSGTQAQPITFRAVADTYANTSKPTVTIPASVQAGDGMLLFLTANSSTVTVTDPAGWTRLGTDSASGIQSEVWQKVATAADAGSAVKPTLSGVAKADLRVAAYTDTAPGAPVSASAFASDTSVTAHVTPMAPVTANGSVAVSYWSDKGTTTTAWTPPAGQTVRDSSYGTGGSNVTTLLTDSGGPVSIGQYGGLTATTNAASAKATEWTIVLAASH